MSSWSFAVKSLLRDLRAGELSVLLTAIIVAVAAMTAVGFFTDRVGRAIQMQAREGDEEQRSDRDFRAWHAV